MRFSNRAWRLIPVFVLTTIVASVPVAAFSDDDRGRYTARLIGYEEVPSINTGASGTLKLEVRRDTIEFELRYNNLTVVPTQSHIHFGERHTNGAIVLHFCGTAAAARQVCPAATNGTIRGTLTASDVQAGQGIPAGDMGAVQRAIRAGAAYANLHSGTFGSGEIRGQISRD